jgi:hypothetical protein
MQSMKSVKVVEKGFGEAGQDRRWEQYKQKEVSQS